VVVNRIKPHTAFCGKIEIISQPAEIEFDWKGNLTNIGAWA
jgi:hypothetical protein